MRFIGWGGAEWRQRWGEGREFRQVRRWETLPLSDCLPLVFPHPPVLFPLTFWGSQRCSCMVSDK